MFRHPTFFGSFHENPEDFNKSHGWIAGSSQQPTSLPPILSPPLTHHSSSLPSISGRISGSLSSSPPVIAPNNRSVHDSISGCAASGDDISGFYSASGCNSRNPYQDFVRVLLTAPPYESPIESSIPLLIWVSRADIIPKCSIELSKGLLDAILEEPRLVTFSSDEDLGITEAEYCGSQSIKLVRNACDWVLFFSVSYIETQTLLTQFFV